MECIKFSTWPTIFFLALQIGEKRRKNGIEKKSIKQYSPFFHFSTFNNKRIIAIYFLAFNSFHPLCQTHMIENMYLLSFQPSKA